MAPTGLPGLPPPGFSSAKRKALPGLPAPGFTAEQGANSEAATPGFFAELAQPITALRESGQAVGDMADLLSRTYQDYLSQVGSDLSEGNIFSLTNPAYAARNIAGRGLRKVWDSVSNQPISETAYEGTKLLGSMVPGGGTAVDAAGDALGLLPDKSSGQYGAQLRKELATYAPFALAGGAVGRGAAKTALRAEASAVPEIEGLQTLAANKGFRGKDAISHTADLVDDKAAVASEISAFDKTSDRALEAGSAIEEVSDSLIASRLFERGGVPNPLKKAVGKDGKEVAVFEGGAAPQTVEELVTTARTASDDLMEQGSQIADDLTEAQRQINARTPDLTGHVRGITFESIAPELQRVRELITKRYLNQVTKGEAETIQARLAEIESDFGRVLNRTDQNNQTFGAISNSFEYGELSPKDAYQMLQNLNAARRAMGEFDELVKTGRANSTFSDITGNQASIVALNAASDAIQSSLQAKVKEIVERSASAGIRTPQIERAALYDENIFSRINRTYASLQPLAQEARRFDLATSKGLSRPDPRTLIGELKDAGAPTNKQGILREALSPLASYIKSDVLGLDNDALRASKGIVSRRSTPMENLELISRIRNNGIPDLAFTEAPGFNPRDMLAAGGAAGVVQQQRMADRPFPRTTGALVANKEQFAQRAGQLAAAQVAKTMGPLLTVAPAEAEKQAMAVAEKTRQDVLSLFEAGDPFRLRDGLTALGSMLPDLFETRPGQYATELDDTIDSDTDGPTHIGVTMEALRSGIVDSITAANQIDEINSRKTARLLFRPNLKPKPVDLGAPQLDVLSAVNLYLGKKPLGSADY